MGAPWVEPIAFITPGNSGVKSIWYTSRWGTLSKSVQVPLIKPLKTYPNNAWGIASSLISVSAASPRDALETLVRIETPSITSFSVDDTGVKQIRTANWIGRYAADPLVIRGTPSIATTWRATNAPFAKIAIALPSSVKNFNKTDVRKWGDVGAYLRFAASVSLRDSSRWRQPQLSYQQIQVPVKLKLKAFEQLYSGIPSHRSFIVGNKKPVRYQIPAAPPSPITNVTWAVNGYFSTTKAIAVQPTNKFTWGF